jgi:hypothetical protein
MATNLQPVHPSTPPRPVTDQKRYYKMQIKGWTNFDPTGKEINEILSSMDQGAGLMTVVEVSEIAQTLADIKDVDVREHFENAAAVERIISKLNDLPKHLREKLQTAVRGTTNGAR